MSSRLKSVGVDSLLALPAGAIAARGARSRRRGASEAMSRTPSRPWRRLGVLLRDVVRGRTPESAAKLCGKDEISFKVGLRLINLGLQASNA